MRSLFGCHVADGDVAPARCEKRREGGVRLLTWVLSIAVVLHSSSTCVVVDRALSVATSPASCENKATGKGRVTYLDE